MSSSHIWLFLDPFECMIVFLSSCRVASDEGEFTSFRVCGSKCKKKNLVEMDFCIITNNGVWYINMSDLQDWLFSSFFFRVFIGWIPSTCNIIFFFSFPRPFSSCSLVAFLRLRLMKVKARNSLSWYLVLSLSPYPSVLLPYHFWANWIPFLECKELISQEYV